MGSKEYYQEHKEECNSRSRKYYQEHKKELNSVRERHIRLGLCVACSSPADPGYRFCRRHRDSERIRHKNDRTKREKEFKCTKCNYPKHPQMDGGKSTCLYCRERTASLFY
jgi:hypothetical protein